MPESTATATDPENEALVQRLKSTLHLPLGALIDSVTLSLSDPTSSVNATPQFIASLTQLTYAQIETVAQDLEAFAIHRSSHSSKKGGQGDGGRGRGRRIEVKDVMLLGRRNEGLRGLLEEERGGIEEGLERERREREREKVGGGLGRKDDGPRQAGDGGGKGRKRASEAKSTVNGGAKKKTAAGSGKRIAKGKGGRRRGGFIDDEADDDDEDEEDEGSQAEEADEMDVDEDDEDEEE
ncbi:MAG: hypothetical protein Q9160_005463 [Pyrenula sp. 1 TL-2023]